eukprot:1136977-Pelagomonas_calceolata.AAC.1
MDRSGISACFVLRVEWLPILCSLKLTSDGSLQMCPRLQQFVGPMCAEKETGRNMKVAVASVVKMAGYYLVDSMA